VISQQRWHEIWARRGPWACLLSPISFLYGGLLRVRSWLYRQGLLKATRLPVPVLVVGNVYVGGVGKTPITMALARQLALRGWHPGILSRGHRRQFGGITMVTANSTAPEVGDEPLLMHRSTGLPVAVGSDRAQAGRLLLSQHPDLNVLICDDGLQHLALHRDLAVCVFDARRVGNGWLLPAGPLREPWPSTSHASCTQCWNLSSENPPWHKALGVTRQLSAIAINGLNEQVPLHELPQPLNALAAIAQPELFFQGLRDLGVSLNQTLALPDHDPLTSWQPTGAGAWVCTEKDAVKIWPRHPQVWAIPLSVTLPDGWVEEIDRALHSWLSSRHGHQIA
jgi:tetraacyldisaccharide 4'-kinase